MVDDLVDATVVGDEPVVDGAELGEDLGGDAGLFRDLSGGGLDEGLAGLDVALGRHHSMRPARLRRAMTAIRARPSWTSMTTPPAHRSSTEGRRRPVGGGVGVVTRHCNQHPPSRGLLQGLDPVGSCRGRSGAGRGRSGPVGPVGAGRGAVGERSGH